MYKYLKTGRVILSLLILLPVTVTFLHLTDNLAVQLSFLLKIQFVPALLSLFSGAFLAFAFLIVLTLLFGRIYCSVICPAGTFQDIISRVSSIFKQKKKRRFRFSKPKNKLRYIILAVTVAPFIFGITYPLLLLDPYSNYGRVSAQIFKSITTFFNNSIAGFWPDSVSQKTYAGLVLTSFLLALLFLVTVSILSSLRGRLYCNTICPVGTTLGLISRFSVFKPVINKELCVNCAACVKACKSECIDLKNKKIDTSRCVTCFDCMTVCDYGALKYSGFSLKGNASTKQRDGRREALAAIGLLGVSIAARGVNFAKLKKSSVSEYAITPPGSRSVFNLKDNCTSCNACIAACPNGIIKPASYQYGIDGISLPVLSYNNHFCSYECNVCSQVCPTGAIMPVSVEEKKLIQIGVVNFTLEKCIVHTDGTDCGACDEHCPTKAITMVPYGETGLMIPTTDTSICIGCGGCEYICPARPKAMIITSFEKHGVASKPKEEKQKEVKVDEFGF